MYMIRGKFDFQQYMDQSVHFEGFEWMFSHQTAAIVASSSDICDVIGDGATEIAVAVQASGEKSAALIGKLIESLDVLNSSVVEGSRGVRIDLKEISAGIEQLTTVADYGFCSVAGPTATSNDMLLTISQAITSQDQSLVNEKFRDAPTCLRQKRPMEALEYVMLAIEGDSPSSPRRWMCGPSWTTSESPTAHPGSPWREARPSGTTMPRRTLSTPRRVLQVPPFPGQSRSTNTNNGCPGSGPRCGLPDKPLPLARNSPSSYCKIRLHYPPPMDNSDIPITLPWSEKA